MSTQVILLGLAGIFAVISYFVPKVPLHIAVLLTVGALLFAK